MSTGNDTSLHSGRLNLKNVKKHLFVNKCFHLPSPSPADRRKGNFLIKGPKGRRIEFLTPPESGQESVWPNFNWAKEI